VGQAVVERDADEVVALELGCEIVGKALGLVAGVDG
jgi:hypothetical protein